MLELQAGDVVRLTKAISVTTAQPPVSVSLALPVGAVLSVVRVQGEEAHCLVEIHTDDITANVLVSLSADLDGAEVLRAVDKDLPVDPQPEEEPVPNDCDYKRYSKANIQATTKRPEVFLYQGALQRVGFYDGAVDGWYGKGTAKAIASFQAEHGLQDDGILGKGTATELIRQAEAAGFVADLQLRIMSIIAYYEVSNRRNAFGMAENDIGDNAGANYGIFQCNSLGSVNTMLKLAGRNDLRSQYNSTDKAVVNSAVQDWFGSAEGIATQIKYFEQYTVKGAMKELRDFGAFDAWENDPAMKTHWERAVLLFCDTRIQNGTMWSGSRRPFWKDLVGADRYKPYQNVPELYHGTWWDEQLGKYIPYEDMKQLWWAEYKRLGEDKKATTKVVAQQLVTQNCAADPQAQLLVLAQLRARSSWEKYWFQAVASRRITDVTGHSKNHPQGVVNGAVIDLACEYQL